MIVFLNYQNRGHNSAVLQNINSCGVEVLEVDMKGIAAATNYGLKYFFEKGAKYVAVCSNDIQLPNGWLNEMTKAADAIPETGINAIYCTLWHPPQQTVNGVTIRPNWEVFGVSLYTRKVWEAVGYLNTDFDPYGVLDMDYCYRSTKAGLMNYYIDGLTSNHLGLDAGDGSEYRKMKDEGLKRSLQRFGEWQKIYDKGYVYLPFEQSKNIIDNQQMYGE
jgi:hypothetical protein